MDNFTHSLVGTLVGEAAHDITKDKGGENSRRGLFLTASVLANNFPDLDGLYTSIMPSPLGDLLHHRGHTHTVLLLIPQLLLILAMLFLIPKFRLQLKNHQVLKQVSLVVALGLILHVVLDSLNSYGVHPFYPFSNQWFYGDLVFIIEPFLWTAFAVPLLSLWQDKRARFGLLTIISIIPFLAAIRGFIDWYSLLIVGMFALIVWLVAERTSTVKKKVAVGITAAVFFITLQAASLYRIHVEARQSFQKQNDQHKIIDLVLTPLPADLFCWSLIQIEVNPLADQYIATKSTVSAWPAILAHEACELRRPSISRVEMKISEFVSHVDRDCYLDAWMRFARAPYYENSIAADIRYSQVAINNFSTIEVSSTKRECPRFIPPWARPRQDLLDIN